MCRPSCTETDFSLSYIVAITFCAYSYVNSITLAVFYTRYLTKATAVHFTFLKGKSFQPLNIFKGIITGKEKKIKIVNERKEDYYKSFKIIKTKFLASNFNPKLVKDQLKKIYCKSKN